MEQTMDTPRASEDASNLEVLKFRLERARFRSEIVKWIVVAAGVAVSFAIIDYGKLRLERMRLASDNQLRFIEAYSRATDAAEPEIWKRKLDVLQLFATDDKVRSWAVHQLDYIDTFAALDTLYRETLKTASQLVDPATLNDPERMKARRRFEQLYWADLPFAGESSEVASKMIDFRNGLIAAEKTSSAGEAWPELNSLLIQLSETLRQATRKSSASARPPQTP
jgi:hypothetical protein